MAAATAPAQAQMRVAPADDVAVALQALLDDEVRKQAIPGMIMGVRLPDGSIVIRSAGSVDPAGILPWTSNTASPLGSVTKTFTAVVIMQLVEEGKLTLDDTIDSWFPDQPKADTITLRMLLSHTSGLGNAILPDNEKDPRWAHDWPPIEFVAEANRNDPLVELGTGVARYSNAGYILLGLIVEAVTGNSWEHETRTRIFEPLGLTTAGFVSDRGIWEAVAEGYFRTPDGYLRAAELPNYPHPSTAWANGGVVSSVADLLTFAGALFDGALVSRESLAEMATPLARDRETGRSWGLGGATLESLPGSFGMGGDVPGYHAFFAGLQDTRLVVAALVNCEEGDVIGPSITAFEYLRSLPPTQ
jgi:D-alanyl-D-alanine carboxypeptidase